MSAGWLMSFASLRSKLLSNDDKSRRIENNNSNPIHHGRRRRRGVEGGRNLIEKRISETENQINQRLLCPVHLSVCLSVTIAGSLRTYYS